MGIPVVSATMRKVFGTRNERMVKRYLRVVDQVNSYEEGIRVLTDAELRARTEEYRQKISNGASPQRRHPQHLQPRRVVRPDEASRRRPRVVRAGEGRDRPHRAGGADG
jgi:preprotein translocase subunit SecA